MDTSAIVIHIPHASTVIPAEYLSGLIVDLDELDKEIIWSTDAYCDELFNPGFGTRVIAQYSRLACDVERFRDDEQEPCAQVGQGLLYTYTARGKRFRRDNKALRDKALAEIYDLHHKELEMAVDNAISKSAKNPKVWILFEIRTKIKSKPFKETPRKHCVPATKGLDFVLCSSYQN